MSQNKLMQLEEVNWAMSPAEFDQKMRQWAKDRGLPTSDCWDFQVMMQYCERLEFVILEFRRMTGYDE